MRRAMSGQSDRCDAVMHRIGQCRGDVECTIEVDDDATPRDLRLHCVDDGILQDGLAFQPEQAAGSRPNAADVAFRMPRLSGSIDGPICRDVPNMRVVGVAGALGEIGRDGRVCAMLGDEHTALRTERRPGHTGHAGRVALRMEISRRDARTGDGPAIRCTHDADRVTAGIGGPDAHQTGALHPDFDRRGPSVPQRWIGSGDHDGVSDAIAQRGSEVHAGNGRPVATRVEVDPSLHDFVAGR